MTKIKLDLDALIAAGSITAADADRLKGLALPDNRTSAIVNVMLIFGALAIAAAAIALIPDPTTGLILAILSLGGAEILRRVSKDLSLNLLSAALALMGTLGLAGWVAFEFQEAPILMVALPVTGILTLGAIWFRSAFLGALSVLSLGAALGSGTNYWHASYGLFVEQPVITILVFGLLTALLTYLSTRMAEIWARIAVMAARTAFIMVNFGFWVGSLFGDHPGETWAHIAENSSLYEWRKTAFFVPELVFSVGWAAVLLAVIIFARRGGFLSITSIVFLAIHGYTQYFETFGARPIAFLIAGIVLVAGAIIGAKIITARQKKAKAMDG